MRARYAALLLVFFLIPVHEAHAVCTPTVQWVWDGDVRSPDFPRICTAPIVVQITDDNGDGRIDSNDVPDVVFTHYADYSGDAVITVVDGATGTEHFTINERVISEVAAGGHPEFQASLDRRGT